MVFTAAFLYAKVAIVQDCSSVQPLDRTRLAVGCAAFEGAVQVKPRAYLSFTADLLSMAKEELSMANGLP